MCFIHLVSGHSFKKKKKFANFFNGSGHELSESGRIDSQKNQIKSRVNPFSDQAELGQKILTRLAMSGFTSSFIIIIILGGKREEDRQTDLLTSRNRLCQSFSFYLGQL